MEKEESGSWILLVFFFASFGLLLLFLFAVYLFI
jgi:hypothetical protein